MNYNFGDMTLYFAVTAILAAVCSVLQFSVYLRYKKRMLQEKKKVKELDYRKECDRRLGLGCLGAACSIVFIGLVIATLIF